jgi:uncharacterized membrane protein AbrB (regulator of aidB expression)
VDQKEALLRPTLGGVGANRTSIYSTTVGYISAFFGGPIAAAIVALVNSRRLNRLQRDWPFALVAIGVEIAFIQWQVNGGSPRLDEALGSGAHRWMRRLLGLFFFGLAYALHRTFYRNMAIAGISPPAGWLLGSLAIAAGLSFNAALIIWMGS